jgi:mono/diheme cytochrome c family protein
MVKCYRPINELTNCAICHGLAEQELGVAMSTDFAG